MKALHESSPVPLYAHCVRNGRGGMNTQHVDKHLKCVTRGDPMLYALIVLINNNYQVPQNIYKHRALNPIVISSIDSTT